MFIDFEIYPDGIPVTINTRQVTTVGPCPTNPEVTVIRFSDGREVLVKGAKVVVMAKPDQSSEHRAFRIGPGEGPGK